MSVSLKVTSTGIEVAALNTANFGYLQAAATGFTMVGGATTEMAFQQVWNGGSSYSRYILWRFKSGGYEIIQTATGYGGTVWTAPTVTNGTSEIAAATKAGTS